MKKWLILLLMAVIATPAFAGRPKLRGPSRPKPKRIVRVNTGHCQHRCHRHHTSRLRKYSKRPSRVCLPPRRVVIVVRTVVKSTPKPKPRPRIVSPPRHKTIIVAPLPYIKKANFPKISPTIPDWVTDGK